MIGFGKSGIGRVAGLVAAAALAASGLSVATAGTAAAADPAPKVIFAGGASPRALAPEDCPADYLCVYFDRDFLGDAAWQPITDEEWPPGTCGIVTDEIAAQVSSIVNNTGRHVSFFYDAACDGDRFVVPPGGQVAYVGNLYNDHVFAVQV